MLVYFQLENRKSHLAATFKNLHQVTNKKFPAEFRISGGNSPGCMSRRNTGSGHLQLIKFWPSCAPGKGVCGGAKIFGSALLQRARSVCVSLSAFFINNGCPHCRSQTHKCLGSGLCCCETFRDVSNVGGARAKTAEIPLFCAQPGHMRT